MYWTSTFPPFYSGQGNGQGSPEKSTGPPNPASASNKLIITAIAASSLPSKEGPVFGDSLTASSIISIIPSSEFPPKTSVFKRYCFC